MKKVLMFSILLACVLMSACSNGEDYLEINPEWLTKKVWILEGEINGWNISGAKMEGNETFWVNNDKSSEAIWSQPGIRVYRHKDSFSISPGQLTCGEFSSFIVEKLNKTNVVLKEVENHFLTNTANVRFSQGDDEDSYVIHINYKGKSHKLMGYMK